MYSKIAEELSEGLSHSLVSASPLPLVQPFGRTLSQLQTCWLVLELELL